MATYVQLGGIPLSQERVGPSLLKDKRVVKWKKINGEDKKNSRK